MDYKKYIPLIILLLMVLTIIITRTSGYEDTSEDIYYIFLEGKRITEGTNPYARVLEGDMVHNDKYATYFPLAYLNAAFFVKLGFKEFSQWLKVWTVENSLFVMGIGILIYLSLYSKVGMTGSLLGTIFWFFNAFTLKVMKINHVDFFAIFFLLSSLLLIRKRHILSLMLFGISISVKHIGVFIAPILIIYMVNNGRSLKSAFRDTIIYSGVIPFILSIPFLIWSFEGFLKSIWFSVSRAPASHFGTQSFDDLLNLKGFLGKLILLFLCGLVYRLYQQGEIRLFLASFILMALFVGFNSVLFFQYLIWPLVFIPFLMIERFDNTRVWN